MDLSGSAITKSVIQLRERGGDGIPAAFWAVARGIRSGKFLTALIGIRLSLHQSAERE
jgi:hypothetical protein